MGATTSAPYAYRETTGGSDSTLGPCGLILYDPRINLLSVTSTRIRTNTALSYFAFRDPVQQYLAASPGRHVGFRGKTTFRGVPAYELDVSRRGEVVTSYLVRRDNYYPLRIVWRRGSSKFTTTYARFNYLPRNAETERLLTMRPHLGAFLMHFGGPNTPACKRFGSYDSISGKRASVRRRIALAACAAATALVVTPALGTPGLPRGMASLGGADSARTRTPGRPERNLQSAVIG